MKKRKPGRPATKRGVYESPRMLGRVADGPWEQVKEAARKAGKPFSVWAMEVMLAEAERISTREAGGQVGKE